MNEDFYIENQETWYDHLYFEPPYDPYADLYDYDAEADDEWEIDEPETDIDAVMRYSPKFEEYQ